MLESYAYSGTRVKIAADLIHGRAMSRMGVPTQTALKDARGKTVGVSIYRNGKYYFNVLWDGAPEGTAPTELSATFLDKA
jgi:hypothetical protein